MLGSELFHFWNRGEYPVWEIPGLEPDTWTFPPHPLDKFRRRGHGGKPTLPDQSPVGKLAGFLDFMESDWRLNQAEEPEIGDGQLGIGGVGTPVADHLRHAHHGGVSHAVINEDPV